jgi:hypothetical protein
LGVGDPLCLSSSALQFSDYSLLAHWLLTRMTGISLHMQWPLTFQSHDTLLEENRWFFSLRIKLHALWKSFITPSSF